VERKEEFSMIVAVASHKGGVGKTTAATNLAAAMASQRQRVLLVDMDPQANATMAMGLSRPAPDGPYVGDLLLHTQPSERVLLPAQERIMVAPSHRQLKDVAEKMERSYYKHGHLQAELVKLYHAFDSIIIDCPPSLGVLTANAICAADAILVPLPLDTFAYSGLEDLRHEVENLRLSSPIPLFILVSQYDPRTRNMNEMILSVLRQERRRVLQTSIPRCEAIRQAQGAHVPVLTFAPTATASQAFRSLATEIDAYV
jgi:chromosome partitioning protein